MRRTLRQVIIFSMLISLAGAVQAKPIDLEGRDVPFDLAAGSASARSTAQAGEFRFSATLNAEQLTQVYGLLVKGPAAAKVSINGRTVDMEPLSRKDGLLYRVDEQFLKAGDNQFLVEGEASSWSDVKLFSLENTTEDAHFNQVFSDTPAAAPPAPDPDIAKYDALWYDCNWIPSMTSTQLQLGTYVWMGGRSLDSSLQNVALHFDTNSGGMIVRGVDSGPSTPALPYVLDSTYGRQRIVITLPAPVPVGQEFRVRIQYDGSPRTTGTFGNCYVRSTHGPSSTAVVYTFSEPYHAPQWWPCKDLPNDKASTTTHRISVPFNAGWQVVSHGLLSPVTNNGILETWTWVNDKPISTYLVSMCISNYTYITSTYTSRNGLVTMPVTHAIYPENIGIEGNNAVGTVEIMNYFADKFGEYPFLNQKYFTAAHNSGSGMEHQTCTSMPGTTSVSNAYHRRNVHELAHHWFGDKITCETFNDVWLNEGFATYCEALFYEHAFGLYNYWTHVETWDPSESQPMVGPNSDNFSNAAVYDKGGLVLHMLRHVVGDTAFFQILRDWANLPSASYGNATSVQFETLCESISGKDLTAFFNQWLFHPTSSADDAYPEYRFHASSSKVGPTTELNMQVNQIQPVTIYSMPLDLEIVDETGTSTIVVKNNNLASQSFSHNTGSVVPCELHVDADGWIVKDSALSINTCGLPRAEVNKLYQYRLQSSFIDSFVTWTGGAGLPAGMSMSSAGLISGTPTVPGTYTVNVTATDDSFTRSTSLVLDVVSTPLPTRVIVESRNVTGSGAAAGNGYSETGTFVDSTSKSSAPGAVGIGARYSVTNGATASFRPAIPVTGNYNIYVTLDDQVIGFRNNANANYTITHNGGTINGSIYLNPRTPGIRNKWLLLASNVPFVAGSAGTVGGITFTNVDGNSSTSRRFVMDSVKFSMTPTNAAVEEWLYE